MRKIFLNIIFILGIFLSTSAQENIKDYVIKNAVTIKTIQPEALDYSDIEVIGNAIGDSRIVMLGEQDHGDAPTFFAKTRLVKYLHEKKGFNVLAFEADFYALSTGWDQLMNKNIAVDSFPLFLKDNIHSVWTLCSACDPLFKEYITQTSKTNTPLIIAGFDNQPLGSYSLMHIVNELDSFLTSQNISFVHNGEYKKVFIPLLNRFFSFKYPKDSLVYADKILLSYFNTINNQLSELNVHDEFWELTVNNIKSFIEESLYYILYKNAWKSSNTRDEQMAKNLEWIVKRKYPNEKVIVWAASSHIVKKSSVISRHNCRNHSMGEYFTKDSTLNKMTYILGFDSKYGTAGAVVGTYQNKAYPVWKAKKNSFENWIESDLQYAFVDFKKFRNLNPRSNKYFNMKGFGHVNTKAIWTEGFDGVFYIRDTYSCIGLRY